MRGAVDVAELDLRGGAVGVHVEREGELEQLLSLVPVDPRLELDPGRAGVERDRLL